MDRIVELINLAVGYSGVNVLSDVSLSVGEGEVISLLGSNGSGKSTLGKAIAGLLSPQCGRIEVEGKDISTKRRKEISKVVRYLPSELFLPEYMTVIDFVSLDASKENSERVLCDVGMSHYVERYVSELSSGERQKMMIASALACESKVIILDEPLSHLDRVARIEILEIIRTIAKVKGVSFLIITHEWELAEKFSDKMWVIENRNVFVTKELNI